ncbi:hypothetical protein D8T39_03385 [Vibrio vulnificus]|nr:hypothetical protein D8T62_09165 [Vibrio vulnificus]RZQ13512.1 hypothetical protein D8T39_03385 [Vibrio vulnificus]RZQ24226.1 hypothetical protein D8T36_15620 [Vibrio vulnificus]RZQ30159.1 hypothetical protein D8T42_13820 [Vibrio vulnificus]RZQ79743.1 hypothetical protein D8T31_12605 [Vibrio vulnificus]
MSAYRNDDHGNSYCKIGLPMMPSMILIIRKDDQVAMEAEAWKNITKLRPNADRTGDQARLAQFTI